MGSGDVKRVQATQPTGQGVFWRPCSSVCEIATPRPEHRTKLLSTKGRLATFPSPQDAASVTAPWDPGRKSWGDGRRRPTESLRFPQKRRSARIKGNCGWPRQQGAGKPQKPSLFCTSTRGNPQKSSLRERFEVC